MNRAISILLLTYVTASCISSESRDQTTNASAEEKRSLDEKVAAEPPTSGPNGIAERAADVFSQAEGLTPDQKKKLMVIYLNTYKEASQIGAEIGKSKSLLFKVITTRLYNSADVENIKKKVVALDQKRLTLMFKSLADVQAVVGVGIDKEQIYKHFYDYEYPRYQYLSNHRGM